MTTVQTMLFRRGRSVRAVRHRRPARGPLGVIALGLAALAVPCGCAGRKDALIPPEVIVAPYDTARGEVLWAVAPLGNESGVSVVDTAALADSLVAKIDEVRGVACLPLNRTLAAMRARGMTAIRSPQDARVLATTLGVDALVLGSVTAYDPYDPPKLGLTLALYSREGGASTDGFDPMKLQGAFTDYGKAAQSRYLDRPVAVVSTHLDGANHEVQSDLKRYASGRSDQASALGWRGHLASMDLYTAFAAHWAVDRLIQQERIRLGHPVVDARNEDRSTPP